MKITHFCFENFKGYATRTKIPLSPITAIYGQNSSGKSAIIQAMEFFTQLVINGFTERSFAGPLEDFLDYENIVYMHDKNRQLRIGIMCSFEDKGRPFETIVSEHQFELYFVIDDAVFREELTQEDQMLLVNRIPIPIEIYCGDEDSPLVQCQISPMTLSLDYKTVKINYYSQFVRKAIKEIGVLWESKGKELLSDNEVLDQLIKQSLHSDFARYRRYGIYKGHNISTLLDIEGLTPNDLLRIVDPSNVGEEDFEKVLRFFWDRTSFRDHERDESASTESQKEVLFSYIKNLVIGNVVGLAERTAGQRMYSYSGFSPEGIAETLIQLAKRFASEFYVVGPIRSIPGRNASKQLESNVVGIDGSAASSVLSRNKHYKTEVNRILDQLGVPYEITFHRAENIRKFFFIELKEKLTNLSTSFQDVGIGISQLIPIVVQTVVGSKPFLALEQPELHLHPRLQGNLAQMLAELIERLKENRDLRLIIETHSESMALRWQKLVRRDLMDKETISFIYVNRDESRSTITEINLDEDGDFTRLWPEGFFEERMEELF